MEIFQYYTYILEFLVVQWDIELKLTHYSSDLLEFQNLQI